MIIGTYKGREQINKKTVNQQTGEVVLTPVDGMYELTFVSVQDRGRHVTHRLTYSETDWDGDVTRFQERVIEGPGLPPEGTLVAVRFASKGTISKGRPFANDTATGLTVLDGARPAAGTK
jgi:hypothetical protein